MRAKLTITSGFMLAACGQSDMEKLHEAANQSDALAAENGMNPQDALREAGSVAAEGNSSANIQ